MIVSVIVSRNIPQRLSNNCGWIPSHNFIIIFIFCRLIVLTCNAMRIKRFKCSSCSLWGPKFWNNFFDPRQKGIFLVLLMTILVIGFTLCYILLALYYEALCKSHADAYLIMFFSNMVHLVVGILVLHFLTVPPKQLTVLRAATIYGGLGVGVALSITAIILWNSQPTNGQMKDYVTNFFHAHNRVPRIFARLHQDSKCCGVNGFEDFIPKNKKTTMRVERVPDSCCSKNPNFRKVDCGNFRGHGLNDSRRVEDVSRNTTHFHIKGCFFNSTFADLNKESPSAYRDIRLTVDWAYTSPCLLVILAVTFSYYACFKLLHDKEGSPEWAQDEFKAKLLHSLQCFSPQRQKSCPPSKCASFNQMHEEAKPSSQLTTSTVSSMSTTATASSASSSTTAATTASAQRSKNALTAEPSIDIRTVRGGSEISIDVDDKGRIIVSELVEPTPPPKVKVVNIPMIKR